MKIIFLIIISFSLNLMGQNFEGKVNNADFNYLTENFSYCSFSDFKIYSRTEVVNININSLKNNYIKKSFFQEESSHIEVISMISFNYYGKEEFVLCYKENSKNEKLVFISNESNDLSELFKIISKLNNDSFRQFYNKENNKKHPEINSLKLKCKDANGVLNIEKLAKVLEENKTSLAKYFDN